jgi:hypothetical protein
MNAEGDKRQAEEERGGNRCGRCGRKVQKFATGKSLPGRWTTQCIPLRGIRKQLLVNITTMKAAKPTQSMVNRIQEKKKAH